MDDKEMSASVKHKMALHPLRRVSPPGRLWINGCVAASGIDVHKNPDLRTARLWSSVHHPSNHTSAAAVYPFANDPAATLPSSIPAMVGFVFRC